ncbi:hypothetical protein [Paenibacillus sp. FJAT-26967]|uniref:hypothetical protein n=1 Tax=Paenibacillus sp. FJAT-26967 TaxID=1729690 RepID=UPI000A6100B1|nr:hypothetical protein [Paenibacillus sp. FJAT-26967]
MKLTEHEQALILGWIYMIQKLPNYKFSVEENAIIDKFTSIDQAPEREVKPSCPKCGNTGIHYCRPKAVSDTSQ